MADRRQILRDPAERSARSRPTVVYIEDNASSAALMSDVFEELIEAQLFIAETARIGIQLVRQVLPDLVLMDIHLPDMDGFEATRHIRSWPETRCTPIIAVTAAAMLHDVARCEDGLFDRYLTKPIRVDELAELVAALFARSESTG